MGRLHTSLIHIQGAKRNQGQAIVLVALVMIGLLGFTALSIDGGAMYFAQRDTQNTADAAVLAATQALCVGETFAEVQQAALNAALINGFNNDGITNTVTVNNPPTLGAKAGDTDYIEVIIWEDVETYLINVVYQGPTEVTIRGVGRCRPERVAFSGYSLVGLSSSASKTGIAVGGGGTINITGGGALTYSSNTTNGAITAGGGSVFTVDGDIDANGTMVTNGGATISAGGSTNPNAGNTVFDPLGNLAEPPDPGSCQNVSNIGNGDVVALSPGCYNGIQMTGGTLSLANGIYYFKGEVKITGGDFFANNVMIFMKSGGFAVTGGTVTMTAQTSTDWAGMVLYSARTNTSSSDALSFTATSKLILTGTVYAPGVEVSLAGQSGDEVTGQIIADTVVVTGTGTFDIIYDEDFFFKIPPTLEIAE